MDPNFFGPRLMQARKMAGYTMQQLADLLDNVVTKQALSKYESGLMKPSSTVLLALCRILKVEPDFFFLKEPPKLGDVSWRKKASTPQRLVDSVVERTRDYVERYAEAQDLVAEVTGFENPLVDVVVSSDAQVEELANRLRAVWNLGTSSIGRVIELLEERGVRVLLLDEDDAIDGLFVYADGSIPVVVVNKRNKSIERLRFTIIHELAHGLLNFSEEILANARRAEELCHLFSTCFLLPKEALVKELGSKSRYFRIEELLKIKLSYGISLRAIIHRLEREGLLAETYYRRWMVYLTKTYGPKEEPGVFVGEEVPRKFEHLLHRGLAEGVISTSKAASLLGVAPDHFQRTVL
jgi:Zn-dependent peptidase ImmA (M78 family)/transcriptional regulator with XRE-family HTH domain